MKRDHAWLVPLLDKRKQVHTGMAKINMHEIGAMPFQQRVKRLIFPPVNNWRSTCHEFQPPMHEKACAALRNNLDVIKRKPLRILDLLGNNKGIYSAQRLYLPVDVQHLRLKKAGAIARYNPFPHTQRPVSLWIVSLSISNCL